MAEGGDEIPLDDPRIKIESLIDIVVDPKSWYYSTEEEKAQRTPEQNEAIDKHEHVIRMAHEDLKRVVNEHIKQLINEDDADHRKWGFHEKSMVQMYLQHEVVLESLVRTVAELRDTYDQQNRVKAAVESLVEYMQVCDLSDKKQKK